MCRCVLQADVWSLGITGCEMAKGYPPYANLTAMQVLMKTMRDKPPTLKDYPSVRWMCIYTPRHHDCPCVYTPVLFH